MLRALECDFATTKLSWFIFATKMPLCPMTLWSLPLPSFRRLTRNHTVAPIAVAAFSKHLSCLALLPLPTHSPPPDAV